MRTFLRLTPVVLALAAMSLSACKSPAPAATDTEKPAGPGFTTLAPLVGHVTPATGPAAGETVVLLQGDNFAPGCKVVFGRTESAKVTFADARTLTAVTPPGTDGFVDIVVTNPDGQASTFTQGFKYYTPGDAAAPAPVVLALVPAQGPTNGGTVAELQGKAFQPGALVYFGGKPALSTTLSNEGLIVVTAPPNNVGPVDVAVTNPDGRSATLPGGFAYLDPGSLGKAPTLAKIAPPQGYTAGGDALTAAGTDIATGARAYLGGHPVGGLVVEGGIVARFNTPPGNPGLADFSVTNPDGQSATLPAAYNYIVNAPTLSRVDPSYGPIEGGTSVVLVGRNLNKATKALMGGVEMPGFRVVDGSTAVATTPKGKAPEYTEVTVVGELGFSDTLKNAYFYTDAGHPPPGTKTGPGRIVLTRVTPSSGATTGGTQIYLLGDGFVTGATVKVGNNACTEVKVLGANSIRCKTPSGSAGPVSVEVTNLDGGSAKLDLGFSYFSGSAGAPPRVSGIVPSTGPTQGGTVALINGAGFVQNAKVYFGSTEARSTRVLSDGQITAVAPNAMNAGAVNVVVVNPDGTSDSLVSGFAFYNLPAGSLGPVVTGINPSQGPAGTEVEITITGERFQAGAVVFVGDFPASKVSVTSDAEVKATVPGTLATGRYDVTVGNPDGLNAIFTNGYTVQQPSPAISSISPSKGPLAGATSAVILGSGYAPGVRVFFGRTEATDVKQLDSTGLRVTVPAGLAGKVDVVVQNPDGQKATLVDGFEYDPNFVIGPKPTLVDVQPSRGPASGKSVVIVRGTNFAKGASVLFADRLALSVNVVDGTKIIAMTPANAAGPAHVTVINPDGQSAVLAGGFTYVDDALLGPKPTLTGVTPGQGPETRTTQVLSTGKNFKQGAFLFIAGDLAQNPVLLSPTIYQFDAPPHAAGPADVAITNPDGQSAVLSAGFTYVSKPTVSGVVAPSGPTAGGSTVLVSGDGFQAGAQVFFDEVAASAVVVKSASLIGCVTPPGKAGLVTVRVKNPDNQEGELDKVFTYVPPPAFDSATPLTPASGPTTGGSLVVVKGSGFLPGATVTVGGKSATVEVIDGSSLVAEIPAGALGAVDVVVRNTDGQTVTLKQGFFYKDPTSLGKKPTLTGVSPSSGPNTGGTRSAIAGGDFTDPVLVFYGRRPATDVRYVSVASLTATSPASPNGKVKITVENPDGQISSIADAFEFVDPSTLKPAPTLAAVAPQQASIFGGTQVTVSGSNLAPGAVFFFGGRPALGASITDPTSAQVTAPTGNPGAAKVTVTNPDGQTAEYAGAFTFIVPPPEPTTVTPSSGSARGGDHVAIKGKNFQKGATVQFSGVAALNTVVKDAGEIDCDTPPGADGPVNVKVTNGDGQSATLAGGFIYVAPPDVQKVSPTSGPEAGGTSISITGAFFRTGALVKIGAKDCLNIVRTSSALITCTVPAGVAGPAAVIVLNSDGQQGVLSGGFTYLPPVPPPAVTSVSPNAGSIRGGTGVTITGSGFQAGAKVTFNGVDAPFSRIISDTAISASTPPGAAGKVDVVVSNPDGQKATLTQGFTYIADTQLPPLALTTVSPNSGATSGGTEITLSGNGFQNGLAVTVGTQQCLSTRLIGPTTVVCTTAPAAVGGTVDVTITNPDGQQKTLTGGFTYDFGGRFVPSGQNLPLEASGGKKSTLLVDVDKDGDLDVFLVGQYFTWLEINDGTGKFTFANQNLPAEPTCCYNYVYHSARAVDLDKDLDTDLVFLKENELIVYRNDGAGKFTRSNYGFPNGWGDYRNLAIGDLNGDGLPDIFFAKGANWGSGFETVAFNTTASATAAITFNMSTTAVPQVNDQSTAVALGDVDNDGDLDALVVNDQNQQNRLYLNDGKGKFTDVTTPFANNFPVSGGNGTDAAMADINNDGLLDILITFNGQRNRLYLNSAASKGVFTDVTLTARMPADIDSTWNLSLVDIDGDGDLDYVTRRSAGGTSTQQVRIYPNDGTGFFGADIGPSILPAPFPGESLYNLVFGDVNKDGKTDILFVNENKTNRLLLFDGKTSKFRLNTISTLPEEDAWNESSVMGDVDGDGDLDLIVGQFFMKTNGYGCHDTYYMHSYCGGMPVRLYLNDGTGAFFDYTDQRMPTTLASAMEVTLGDVDGDGDLDLLVANRVEGSSQGVLLYMNDGRGNFKDESNPRLPSDGTNRSTWSFTSKFIDFDNDGDLDIIVGQDCTARLWLNIQKNTGFFTDVTAVSKVNANAQNGCGGRGTSEILVGDMDGDGFKDLVYMRYGTSPGNEYMHNKGDGTFEELTSSKMPSASGGRHGVLADFDKDGDLDLYVVNNTDDRLLMNLGGANMSDVTQAQLKTRTDPSIDAVATDVDKDGDLDLVVTKDGTQGRYQTRLLLNIGSANFVDYSSTKFPSSNDAPHSICAGDVNGDKREDVFIGDIGQSRLFLNQP